MKTSRCYIIKSSKPQAQITIIFFVLNIASPVSGKMGPAGSVTASPKAFNPGVVPKQERTAGTGSILNLNLGQQQMQQQLGHPDKVLPILVMLIALCIFFSDRVKAEMDLKELSETVQQQQQQSQQQGGPVSLNNPKRPIRSLDKTIESCKAQLGQLLSGLVLEIKSQHCVKNDKYKKYLFQE